ncbi:MAG: hypothetical protein GY953_03250, partial [bacterium]|nr:hypothetical protein [bacterium]
MIVKVLSGEQVRSVNNRSLEILDRVGVVVPHEEILRRFHDAGARVDFDNQRVRIRPETTMELVGRSGKQYTLHGRDMSRTAAFGQGARNYNSTAGEASWLDEPGGKHRFATMGDVVTAARFSDALEMINVAGAMADPHEVLVAYRCVEVFATMLKNT